MTTKRKFFRTTYTVEILSEDPITASLETAIAEASRSGGSLVARIPPGVTTEIDGRACADELYRFGSEPEFFMLTDEGDDA
jgi:hypothetical protein